MLYLIRHAECEGNRDKVYHGITDSRITLNGYQQIACLGRHLSDVEFHKVYTSTLSRTIITARVLSAEEYINLHILNEFDGGAWEGRSFDIIRKEWGEEYSKYLHDIISANIPSKDNPKERFIELEKFAHDLIKAAETKNIAVVSHGTILRMLESILLNRPIEEVSWLDNACYSLYEIDENKKPRQIYYNYNKHLPDYLRGYTKDKWAKISNN